METRTKTLLDFLEKAEGSGKQFSSAELKAMLVSVSFEIDACKGILYKIKDQTILLSFISSLTRDKEYEKILEILFPLLDLKSKSNDELLAIFTQSDESEFVARTIATHINLKGKTKSELLEIMAKLDYCWCISDKVIPLLKFSRTKKHQELIWSIVKDASFAWSVVRQLIKYILDEDRVMELLKRNDFVEALFYDEKIKNIILSLKKEENILEVLKHQKKTDICCHYLPKIKSEVKRFTIAKENNKDHMWIALIPTLKKKSYIEFVKNKMDTLDKYNGWYKLYVMAYLPHCSTEEEILDRVRKYSNFEFDKEFLLNVLKYLNQPAALLVLFNEIFEAEVKAKIIKKLNLKKETNPRLWHILGQTSYCKDMCDAIVPLLGLEEKSDDDILEVLKQRKNPKYLCLSVMKYIKSQEKRVQVFDYHADEKYIWEASGYLDEATLEAEFVTSWKRKYFLGRIWNRQLVYDTIAKEGFSSELLAEANKGFSKIFETR